MQIKILTFSHKRPQWLTQGFDHYAKRILSPLQIINIKPKKDKKSNSEHEGLRMLKSIDANDFVIALTIAGTQLDSHAFAKKIHHWQHNTQTLTFLIGGADGLAVNCIEKSHFLWSFSLATFPHQLVELILVEQLYRSFSILNGHPYHCSH